MSHVAHTVRREAPGVAVERLFDVVVAEDVLPAVLHRWGPIPGVRGTRDHSGTWDTPYSSRTIVLDDGSTARETLTRFERPYHFEYEVRAMTNPFGRLVDHATGVWQFHPGSGFAWTYTFIPRGPLAAALLRAAVPLAWARYMAACADRCVALSTSGLS